MAVPLSHYRRLLTSALRRASGQGPPSASGFSAGKYNAVFVRPLGKGSIYQAPLCVSVSRADTVLSYQGPGVPMCAYHLGVR